MVDEQTRLYADLLWWFLILLAAGGLPIGLGGIAAMILRMHTMDAMLRMQPPPPPPSFEEWQRSQRNG